MKLTATIMLFSLLYACKGKPVVQPATHDTTTPKALEDKSSLYNISSKRAYSNDLVQELYQEAVEKDPALKTLEQQLAALEEGKDDSMAVFRKFDEKNRAYFNAAEAHLAQIKDSALKQKVAALINHQLNAYGQLTSPHQSLLRQIAATEQLLQDLHTVLKITNTLPVIARYQQQNKPATKPLQGYLNEQQKTAQQLNGLLAK